MLQPGAVLGSRDHTASGAVTIWMAFAAAWGHGGNQTQAAYKDCVYMSVILLQARSMLKTVVHVATKSHMKAGV